MEKFGLAQHMLVGSSFGSTMKRNDYNVTNGVQVLNNRFGPLQIIYINTIAIGCESRKPILYSFLFKNNSRLWQLPAINDPDIVKGFHAAMPASLTEITCMVISKAHYIKTSR